ncbi:hypothetical protein [Streptomyces longispororuber]|uniref:hypothetical protein n=1 Tax=Streptomyces longispororuber TaxID=68230 RepID=UPI0036F5D39E
MHESATMEALRLYAAPAPITFTASQRSGTACVWCERELQEREGIALGGPPPWRPQGCVPCCERQIQALQTYLDWYHHGVRCRRCPRGSCERAGALQRAHLDAQQRAGAPPPWCVECWDVIPPSAAARPILWQGLRGLVFSYVHVCACSR